MKSVSNPKLMNNNNIVLITIDCLRYDTFNKLLKQGKLKNIQKLVNKGTYFTQAISVAPWTPPSVTAFLTSTYPLMFDGYLNFSPRVSFVKTLKSAGYSTVSYQTNAWISKFFNYDRGFSIFEDDFSSIPKYKPSSNKITFIIKKFKYLLKEHAFVEGPYSLFASYKPSKRLVDDNLKLIRSIRKPVFLWVHFMDAHEPYFPSTYNVYNLYKSRKITEKISKKEKLSIEDILLLYKWYKESIVRIDEALGVFLKKLELLDLTPENTYFIISSDHGQEFFEHGLYGHGLHLYEELIHVPLVISGPDIRRHTITFPFSLLDLPPTIIGLAGLHNHITKHFIGKDYSAILKDKFTQEITKKAVISEEGEKNRISAFRAKSRVIKLDLKYRRIAYRYDHWKYIYDERNPHELYTLKRDPKEKNNIIEDEKDIAKELLDKIKQHIKMEEKTKSIQQTYLRVKAIKKSLLRK